jgi:isoquinoline 1-oxidoreductase
MANDFTANHSAMNLNSLSALELAQHEVKGQVHRFELERRDFLKLLGGGILICVAAPFSLAQESGATARGGRDLPHDLASWLHIAGDGKVTVFTGKVEIGQNIRTSLTQAVAEELRAPIDSVDLVMGDTDLTPFDMGTFGSRTTPTMAPQLRAAAAAARELLLDLAAEHWKADRSTLAASDGKIANPKTGETIAYGGLTGGKELIKVINHDATLTPAKEWKVAGTPAPKIDGREFVTGEHQYTSDMHRPGMLYGKVLRPAGFDATLSSVNTAKAESMAGVVVVHDGDFVGIAAADSPKAQEALDAIKADWKVPAHTSDATLFLYLKQKVDPAENVQHRESGSVDQARTAADIKLAQTYTVDYIAHTPLEPRAALAEWSGDKLTVWTGTQRPFAVRDQLAEALRISPGKVRVIVPDTGSAYGGKHTGEVAVEAARLAKAAGKPVKVVWTREEEFTWAYFRPAGVIEVFSGAQKDGTLVSWEFHNYNSGPAAIATPYKVANQKTVFHPVQAPLRQGSYRGLAATANHFARESHMDELAHALGMDPLKFRLKNLADPRLIAVLQAAAEKFGWDSKRSTAQRGFGIAAGVEKGGYVATCAEVEILPAQNKDARNSDAPNARIVRVVEAFECGAVVNPNGLRNQISGAIVQAIGGALFERIRFAEGKVTNAHMNQYRVPRFADVPAIDVVLVDRKDLPSAGAGETPIVGLAPAVANAIFAASGKRIRSMPLFREERGAS